jgi:hypothetical protein
VASNGGLVQKVSRILSLTRVLVKALNGSVAVTILRICFLGAFIGGLVLSVFAMLHGVEHTRRNRSRAPSPFFNLPAIAAFAVGFGAVGYLLASRTTLPAWGILLIAIGGGALAISGMITLLARWALRGIRTVPGEGEEIQGQLAIVSRELSLMEIGEISYEQLGRQIHIPARALSDKPVPVGADVVIDRIENGIAFVEEWATVEERL